MRVLAFDPGFERLGVAVLEKNPPASGGKEVLLFSTCIRTSPKLPFHKRLLALGEEVEKIIKKHKPDAVALESLYFENNAKTAMNVAAVRGALCYIAASHKLEVFEYTPLQVKVAVTGYGKSDKRAVAMMVEKLIKISKEKKLDDELDAIAVGLTCLASTNHYPQQTKK